MWVYLADLTPTDKVGLNLASGRSGWVQVLRGTVIVHDRPVSAGDGVGVRKTARVAIAGAAPRSEVMLFDLP